MISLLLDFFDRRPNLVGYAAGLGVLAIWMIVGWFDGLPSVAP